MPSVQRANTDGEIARCFDVMAELRGHLRREDFVARVREMEAQGFALAYIESRGEVVAVAGYRVTSNLFLGRNLYVDDLVTAATARSRGHGAALLEWLRGEARRHGCDDIHLDSGTQRDRAHKFYFAQGYTIGSYHFRRKVD